MLSRSFSGNYVFSALIPKCAVCSFVFSSVVQKHSLTLVKNQLPGMFWTMFERTGQLIAVKLICMPEFQCLGRNILNTVCWGCNCHWSIPCALWQTVLREPKQSIRGVEISFQIWKAAWKYPAHAIYNIHVSGEYQGSPVGVNHYISSSDMFCILLWNSLQVSTVLCKTSVNFTLMVCLGFRDYCLEKQSNKQINKYNKRINVL